MRFFFRSRQFRIIVAIVLTVIIVSTVFALIGVKLAPQANIAGTVAAPFQSFAATVKNSVTDFAAAYRDGNELMLKNAALEEELNQMRQQIADYNELQTQNEFYKNYLGLKEEHSDFVFTPATLISRDSDDPFGSFVINRGTLSDIRCYDPVITEAGVVGYIAEVGLTTAKVSTLLSPDLTLGALDNRTGDSGIVSGMAQLAESGLCRLYNLSRSCNVAIGDYVVTSGEGIFPQGLLIGKINSIGSDPYNTSIYADVEPFAAFSDIRSVMVITAFDGQKDTSGGAGS